MHGENIETFNVGLGYFFFPQSLKIPMELEPSGAGFSSWKSIKPMSEEV